MRDGQLDDAIMAAREKSGGLEVDDGETWHGAPELNGVVL
jgi:hypothetical protein